MILFDIIQSVFDKIYYLNLVFNTFITMFSLTNLKKINKNLTLLYSNEIVGVDPKSYNINNIEEYLSNKVLHYNNLLDVLKNNIELRALNRELSFDTDISRNMQQIGKSYNSERYKIIQKINEYEKKLLHDICSQL